VKTFTTGQEHHGFQFNKQFLRKLGLNIKDIEMKYPDEIIESMPKQEVFGVLA
jgi:hypothetical protein